MRSSRSLPGVSISEAGSGEFLIDRFLEEMYDYSSQSLSEIDPVVYPNNFDLTSEAFLPYSNMPIFAGMIPISFNFTLIDPYQPSVDSQLSADGDEDLMKCLRFTHSLGPASKITVLKLGIQVEDT